MRWAAILSTLQVYPVLMCDGQQMHTYAPVMSYLRGVSLENAVLCWWAGGTAAHQGQKAPWAAEGTGAVPAGTAPLWR